MNELQAILQACENLDASAAPAVLATVVRVKGSAYRRPGARMLLLPDGQTIGTVSGGCLEGDVKLQAWRVAAAGQPAVVRYDSAADGEIVWQLGMGCKGVVDVLLERVSPGTPGAPGMGPLGFLRAMMARRGSALVARVLSSEGACPVPVGAFWSIDEQGRSAHDLRAPELAALIERDAAAVLAQGQSREAVYGWPTGRAEVFLELVRPSLPLLICGAGHDAIPLARIAKELGWHVTVWDHRPSYATAARFPTADRVVVSDLPDAASATAAVVMTHQYHTDLACLRSLLALPLAYIGLLGPKSRSESLLADLANEGLAPTPQQFGRLFAPVGLDIGAENPEAIALAVLAEIQGVMSGRVECAGRPLRERAQPIHTRPMERLQVIPSPAGTAS